MRKSGNIEVKGKGVLFVLYLSRVKSGEIISERFTFLMFSYNYEI